jgi:SPP1 gp7 family putative phage head morphogenesis protein
MKIDINTLKPKETKARKKEIILRPTSTPLFLEKKLHKFLRFMTKTQNDRFKTQVLEKLRKKDIKQFTDAKSEAYGTVYRKLFVEYKKSINKQFSSKRIQKFVKNLYKDLDKYNKNRFYANINNQIGVDVESIIKTDGLNSFVSNKSLESTDLIERFKTDNLVAYKQNILRRMNAGSSLKDLYEQTKKNTNFSLNRANLIARNEIKTFNTELAKKRSQNLGIKEAIWQASKDERTRGCHHRFNGKQYKIGKGLYCSESKQYEEPGEPINCRCVALPIVNFDKDN